MKALFLDIGGVLLTNGWDRHARGRAAEHFELDRDDLDERHHLTFDTYEEGKLSLDEYLDRVVFCRERSFTREAFKDFMFAQSQALPGALQFFRDLKHRHSLVVVAVSNEGRELNTYRVERFGLGELFDVFLSSSFVHLRKPDADLYRMALDVAQVRPEEVVYVDDRELFVEVAAGLGIRGIHHRSLESTREAVERMGVGLDDE